MTALRYTTPSHGDWNRALPIGNGKLGAMIFGEGNSEHFQLNEDSVWFGQKRNRNNPDALANLKKIRSLIFEGNIEKAEELSKYALTGTPQSQHTYQTLGDVYFDYCGKLKDGIDFERKLDLSEAIHSSRILSRQTGALYTCETFSSAPQNCIISHFSCSSAGELDLAASLQRECFYETTSHTNDTLILSGRLGGGEQRFCCGMKFVTDSSNLEGIGEHLVAKDASYVTVFITAATTFRHKDPESEVLSVLTKASSFTFEELRTEHISEYTSYYNRMHFSLDYDKSLDLLSTDERLERLDEDHPDNGLFMTYMDFGRYLLISSSRGDSLPANLQGIWNRDISAPWGSKYTININTEMNYWPAVLCNLAACEFPLFAHMQRMLPNGQQTAKEMYGCDGFVAHHNTDIWGDTAPQDIYIPSTFWVLGGAWLCTHIWRHYMYTDDMDFLKQMYPLLKESVKFFVNFLVEKDGKLVTCPSVSPENTYIMDDGTKGCLTYGASMDNEILHQLFADFRKAADVIGEKDIDFLATAYECEQKLPDIQIGKHGQIMEWQKDYEEAEPGHRHISHLWALHPAYQITPDGTPKLCEAARTTLSRRLENGGGHTGWSRAWIINMYARLWDEKDCYKHLLALLKKSTLPNLFDNHPPFQIDGNFGATAAMAEMLLQSNEERTIILPALPKAWPKGEVQGLCGVHQTTWDLTWENGCLTSITVSAPKNKELTLAVYYDGVRLDMLLKDGISHHCSWRKV
ncbi:MAG: glycosyl hydrolase family 95 catalytic domain-containing protein [Eubacterium sp.]